MNKIFKLSFLAAAVFAANAHSQTSSVNTEISCSMSEEGNEIVFSYEVDLEGMCELTQTRTIDGVAVVDTMTISSDSTTSYTFEESAAGQTDLVCSGEGVTLSQSASSSCGEGDDGDIDPIDLPTPGSSSGSECSINGEIVPCDEIPGDIGDLPDFPDTPDLPDVPDFPDFPDLPDFPTPDPSATPGSDSGSTCRINGEEVPCDELPDFDFPDFPDLPDFPTPDPSATPGSDSDSNCSVNGETVPCDEIPDFEFPDFPDFPTPAPVETP